MALLTSYHDFSQPQPTKQYELSLSKLVVSKVILGKKLEDAKKKEA